MPHHKKRIYKPEVIRTPNNNLAYLDKRKIEIEDEDILADFEEQITHRVVSVRTSMGISLPKRSRK